MRSTPSREDFDHLREWFLLYDANQEPDGTIYDSLGFETGRTFLDTFQLEKYAIDPTAESSMNENSRRTLGSKVEIVMDMEPANRGFLESRHEVTPATPTTILSFKWEN